ncbi:MAG: hypothetical protein KAR40_08070 [Candidatus Sabulitectum sp.]|nr:hypothetical protein [Candidatus Sabulitectum sp.]
MIPTEEQRKEFEEVVRPLIEWLNVPENAHPHCHVVVDSTHAELSEGICCFSTEDYLKD